MPEWRWISLHQRKYLPKKTRPSVIDPTREGNPHRRPDAQQSAFVEAPADTEHLQVHVTRHDVDARGERSDGRRVRQVDGERNGYAEPDGDERHECT